MAGSAAVIFKGLFDLTIIIYGSLEIIQIGFNDIIMAANFPLINCN